MGKIRAKEKEKDLAETIKNISTEIKNPLNAIELFASLLHEELSDRFEDTTLVTDIMTGVKKIDYVLTNLMYYACLPQPKIEEIDLEEIIEEVLMFSSFSLKTNHIKVIARIDSECRKIHADKEQFKQCIMNLLLNSLKNLDRGGEISISSAKVDKSKKPYMCFELSDTRQKKEFNNDLFSNIFHNIDSSQTNNENLELSLIKKIIEQHDGKIKISNTNKFKVAIYIPVKKFPKKFIDIRGFNNDRISNLKLDKKIINRKNTGNLYQ